VEPPPTPDDDVERHGLDHPAGETGGEPVAEAGEAIPAGANPDGAPESGAGSEVGGSLFSEGPTEPAAPSGPAPLELKFILESLLFASQKALVIGGSRGLGEVTAKYLAAGGAQVLLTYSRGVGDANAIVQDISSHGGIAQTVLFDLTSPNEEVLAVMDSFEPTDIYYFATPFIFSGQKGIFAENRLKQFMDFYLLGFHRIIDHFSKCGVNRYFCPSSIALDENPAAMGEYCVAKAAMEAYCEWVVKNRPGIKIAYPRLPRLATDQTASIATTDNADTVLILKLLREFSSAKRDL
jgi:NADP-dependent 3-hydroxy acid dehydrogenase YdfG